MMKHLLRLILAAGLSVLSLPLANAGTLYVDPGGSATNSGSTDQNAANLTGTAATAVGTTGHARWLAHLSGLVTSGANQSVIHLNQATNANQKIFWITAFDNGAKTVTVDVVPTGITSSAWAIGGRHVLTNASIEGAVRTAIRCSIRMPISTTVSIGPSCWTISARSAG